MCYNLKPGYWVPNSNHKGDKYSTHNQSGQNNQAAGRNIQQKLYDKTKHYAHDDPDVYK